MQREVGVTFIFVTHAQGEALALALSHRIGVMRQGRIEQVDKPSKLYGFPNPGAVAHLDRDQVAVMAPGFTGQP